MNKQMRKNNLESDNNNILINIHSFKLNKRREEINMHLGIQELGSH